MAFADGQSDEPPMAEELNGHGRPQTSMGTPAIAAAAAAVLPVVRIGISRLIDHLKAESSLLSLIHQWMTMHH